MGLSTDKLNLKFKNSNKGGSKGDLSNYTTAGEKKGRRKFLRDTNIKNKFKSRKEDKK